MKSSIRCKSTFQGDRCRFEVGHMALAPQGNEPMRLLHAGQFTCWDDAGVKGKAIGAEMRHKRNRVANRVSRKLLFGDVDRLPREKVLADLTTLTAFYGGGQPNA